MASADNAATPASAEDHNDLFNAFQTSVHLVEESNVFNHVFTVLGASGDLAKKKIYPTLWALFRDKLVPDQTYFVGYARSSIDMRKFLTDTCYKFMKVREGEEPLFAEFVARNYYLAGSYDKPESFQALNAEILRVSKIYSSLSECNRIFYLALPPSVYTSVTELLSHHCKAAST